MKSVKILKKREIQGVSDKTIVMWLCCILINKISTFYTIIILVRSIWMPNFLKILYVVLTFLLFASTIPFDVVS